VFVSQPRVLVGSEGANMVTNILVNTVAR